MATITVTPNNQSESYTIHIKHGVLTQLQAVCDLAHYSKILVITDTLVAPKLLESLLNQLPEDTAATVLSAGESHKTVATVQHIWTEMHRTGLDRKSLVINLGGGVIGDLGGFAASTYMRGIDFINIPTTLLSQVDASVGGKTGFNFDGVKNLIGTFSQPTAVIIDPQCLASLPEREFVAGFGEIIKHGLVWDTQHFEAATAKSPLAFSQDELAAIITASVTIKVAVVESDTTESGQRKLVNFGHTIGHAIEALSLKTDQPLLHGEAISIGMVAESHIAVHQGLLTQADSNKITVALEHAGLPVAYKGLESAAIVAVMQSDKKNTAGSINFVLLDRIGHALYDQKVPEKLVINALEATRQQA
jgi:3-dehydroquinate synthase